MVKKKEDNGVIQEAVKKLILQTPVQKQWKPSEFISVYWKEYKKNFPNNNSVNGGVFEQLLILSLLREGISPIYTQAQLAFVPNVNLDIVLYNRKTTSYNKCQNNIARKMETGRFGSYGYKICSQGS